MVKINLMFDHFVSCWGSWITFDEDVLPDPFADLQADRWLIISLWNLHCIIKQLALSFATLYIYNPKLFGNDPHYSFACSVRHRESAFKIAGTLYYNDVITAIIVPFAPVAVVVSLLVDTCTRMFVVNGSRFKCRTFVKRCADATKTQRPTIHVTDAVLPFLTLSFY